MKRKLKVIVGITDEVDPPLAVDAAGLSLWLVEADGDVEARTLSVTVGKVTKPSKSSVPATLRSDLRSGFSMAMGDVAVSITGADGAYDNVVCYASHLSLAVKRLATTIFGAYMGQISINIKLAPFEAGVAMLSFDTLMTLDFSEPLNFGRNIVFTTIDAAVPEIPNEVTLPSDDVVDVVAPTKIEGSEIAGDVRYPKYGDEAEWQELTPLAPLPREDDSSACDASLYSCTAPVDKYSALARLVELTGGGGKTLVVGDHPGTLSRSIAALGLDVVGVDPLNRAGTVEGREGIGDRELLQGSLSVTEDDPLICDDWGAVIADTGVDGEAAEVATARNVGLAVRFDELGCYSFCQLRSMPLRDGLYAVFMLPGTSRIGCETYCHVNPVDKNGTVEAEWFRLRVREGVGVVTWGRRYARPLVIDHYFRGAETGTFEVDAEGWYALIASRHFIEAGISARDELFDYHALRARNAADLYSRLSLGISVDAGEERGLRATFEKGRVCNVPGVAHGAFVRSAIMPTCIAARYAHLLGHCVAADTDDPGGLRDLMLDSRSGALLRDLSGVRAAVGAEVRLAVYSRVLPYQHMAILASRTFFRAINVYIAGVATMIGRPMHAWELQYLLWSLTNFGTRSEKVKYLFIKLGDALYYDGGGRRMEAPSEHSQSVRTFLNKLDDLGIRGEYVKLDSDFSAGIANSVTTGRKREQVGSMGPPPKRRPTNDPPRTASAVSTTSSWSVAVARRPRAFRG